MPDLNNWRSRIKLDPAVHHGDPCIAGTRLPVAVIVGSVADGDSWDTILRSYPQIAREDVQAALLFAAEAVSRPRISEPRAPASGFPCSAPTSKTKIEAAT